MRNSRRFLRAIAVLLAVSWSAPLLAGGQNDYWNQQNKDGHWRNSSSNSIQGSLRLRWTRALTNFFDITSSGIVNVGGRMGQRSNNFSVRDGHILLFVPPVAGSREYANVGVYSITDGSLINSAISAHLAAGGLWAGSGAYMDSDMGTGLINQYWHASGYVYSVNGSDMGSSAVFNPYTGEEPFGVVLPTLGGGINGAGCIAMSQSNPLAYARGGGNSHNPFDGGAAYGFMGLGEVGIDAIKMYAGFAIEGDWVYSLNMTNKDSLGGVAWGLGTSGIGGVQISAAKLSASPCSVVSSWTYNESDKGFLGFGLNHCQGAPRAYCLGEDGRLYYYGYYTSGSGSSQLPDWSKGTFLAGIQTAGAGSTRTNDLLINTGYLPTDDSSAGVYLREALWPQIATRTNYVVVFQPQQTNMYTAFSYRGTVAKGHVFCFDTAQKTLLWKCNYPAGFFNANTAVNIGNYNSGTKIGDPLNREQAVQLTIAGDKAYVVEPYVNGGSLTIRVLSYTLAVSNSTQTVLTPLVSGQPIAVSNATTVALRDVAAVDGTLVCVVDYDRYNQALVVIEGDATPAITYAPTAVISAPVTGALKTDRYGLPPTIEFCSGCPIAFSSQGSYDAGGQPLGYMWDFGDGNISTNANPTHTYASWGMAPDVTNRMVTLVVTNASGGRSYPASRVLWIRDAGASTTTTLVAVADSYVNYGSLTQNYGTDPTMTAHNRAGPCVAYIRFDLGAIAPSDVSSASLRIFCDPSTGDTPAPDIRICACTNAWDELTIAATNAPAPGAVLAGTIFRVPRPHSVYVDIPVTAYVRATGSDRLVSFAITEVNTYDWLVMSSREGTHAPELVLRTGDAGFSAPVFVQPPPAAIAITNADTGTLSLLADSPAGESALAYTWYLDSAPAGATLLFMPQSGNDAKNLVFRTRVWGIGGALQPMVGIYTIHCTVSDGLRTVNSDPVTITVVTNAVVSPNVPQFTEIVLGPGTVGIPYTGRIRANNSPTNYAAVNLPAGLVINHTTGDVTGAPTRAGTYSVSVSAANTNGTAYAGGENSAQNGIYTVLVALPPVPVITNSLVASAQVGQAFNYAIAAMWNPASFNAWGLPLGLMVNKQTGVISGTPAEAGTFEVLLGAANDGGIGTATLALNVSTEPGHHTINATAGDHGRVEPAGVVLVDDGGNQTFSIIASNYYHVEQVLVDGMATGAVSSYTFTSVVTNHTLDAAFEPNLCAKGTPEWWLASYGLTNYTFDVEETRDADSDGAQAWQEYIAGTIPTNPNSVFAVTSTVFDAGSAGFVLCWPSVTSRQYAVSRISNLVDGVNYPIASNLPATPPQNVYTDSLPSPANLFYRIRVTQP